MRPLAQAVKCTLSCRRLLFVLGMDPTSRDEDAPTLAAAQTQLRLTTHAVEVVGNELFVELDDPVEAISLALAYGLVPRRCLASPSVVELLREPGAPARAAWTWLCARFLIDPEVSHAGLARGLGGGCALPADAEYLAQLPGVGLWILEGAGDHEGGRLEQLTRTTLVGRDRPGTTVDLPIKDRLISKEHCRFSLDDHWRLEDVSLSGTFIHDERVAHRIRVLPGMEFRLGGTRLVVLSVR